MNQATQRNSRRAAFSLSMGVLAIVLGGLGGLGARVDTWLYGLGLLFMPLGLLVGVSGLLLGLIALLRRRKAGEPLGFAAAGTGVSALGSLYVGSLVLTTVPAVPIHNVSTDIEDPPEFTAVASLRGAGDNPLLYDSATLGPLQRAIHPDLGPLVTDMPRDRMYELVRGVLIAMDLELVREDPDQGEIEAVATTFWLGFKDDLVVRLRETEAGTRMDIRSVSRFGGSDIGTNTERIFEIFRRVEDAG